MSDAPERIWAARSKTSGATMWWPDNAAAGTPYVLASTLEAAEARHRAELAAAYEAAARRAETYSSEQFVQPLDRSPGWRNGPGGSIRALTPTDASAALDAMLAEARAEGIREASEGRRGEIEDAVADAIGSCAYDCTRVWEAWGVGTMSESDFVPITDDKSRVSEIAGAAILALLGDAS